MSVCASASLLQLCQSVCLYESGVCLLSGRGRSTESMWSPLCFLALRATSPQEEGTPSRLSCTLTTGKQQHSLGLHIERGRVKGHEEVSVLLLDVVVQVSCLCRTMIRGEYSIISQLKKESKCKQKL